MEESTEVLLGIADDLYALAPAAFTAARDERARSLRGDGDAELAARVKALRRPTAAAWVVDLLVRRESGQVEQMLSVGSALRAAQAVMSPGELRSLTRQRRQVTAALTTRARQLAAAEGTRVTEAVASQVEATLTAAMLDATCARAVASGLLVAPLTTTGVEPLGPEDVAASLALPEALGAIATPRESAPAPVALHVVPDPETDAKRLAAAEERHDDADRRAQEAAAAADEAQEQVDLVAARTLQAHARIDELRRELAEAEEQAEALEEDAAEAEEALAEAAAHLRTVGAERDAAREALERLRSRLSPPRG